MLRSIAVPMLLATLAWSGAAKANLLSLSTTNVIYRANGSEIQPTDSSNPVGVLGPGAWSLSNSGQGPHISVESQAEFHFAAPQLIHDVSLEGLVAQTVQGETNQGTSTWLRIEGLSLNDIWNEIYFDQPYENNWGNGPSHHTEHQYSLLLQGAAGLADPLKGLRYTVHSAGYSNSPPGIPQIDVSLSLDSAGAQAVPEPSAEVLAALALAGMLLVEYAYRRKARAFSREML